MIPKVSAREMRFPGAPQGLKMVTVERIQKEFMEKKVVPGQEWEMLLDTKGLSRGIRVYAKVEKIRS